MNFKEKQATYQVISGLMNPPKYPGPFIGLFESDIRDCSKFMRNTGPVFLYTGC